MAGRCAQAKATLLPVRAAARAKRSSTSLVLELTVTRVNVGSRARPCRAAVGDSGDRRSPAAAAGATTSVSTQHTAAEQTQVHPPELLQSLPTAAGVAPTLDANSPQVAASAHASQGDHAPAASSQAVAPLPTVSGVQAGTDYESEYTEVVERIQVVAEQAPTSPLATAQQLASNPWARGVGTVVLALLAGSLAVALWRTYKKTTSAQARKRRQVDRNRLLVDELNSYLPSRRAQLTAGALRGLKGRTGFTPVEVFRKYLWYVLRERTFDQGAVDDLLALARMLELTPMDVAEALKERSQRVYDKYGTLMLNTEGLTAAGIERKATCRALFQKLLYLTEMEVLIPAGSEAAKAVDLRKTFGATDEDVQRLRLPSLSQLDEAALERLYAGDSAGASDSDTDSGEPGQPSQAPAPAAAAEQGKGDSPGAGPSPGQGQDLGLGPGTQAGGVTDKKPGRAGGEF